MNNYRYFAVIIIFLILIIIPSVSNSEKINSSEWLIKAIDELEKGELENALNSVNNSIKLDTKNADAYLVRGHVYKKFGDSPPEMKEEKKTPWRDKAVAKKLSDLKLKYYLRAIENFDEAIRLKPKDTRYYFDRGNTYAGINQHLQAIEDYNQAISLDPNFADAYNNRGAAYNELGQHFEAVADLNYCIQLKPNEATYYRNRGNAYFELHKRENACSDYKKACELGGGWVACSFLQEFCK